MADLAQSISANTKPPALSPEPPKQDHADALVASPILKPPTKRQHGELLALAALGATFGFLTGWGLWTEIHYNSVEFVLAVVPFALAAYVFVDPLSEWIKGGGEESSREGTERRGVTAGVSAAASVLAVAAIEHSLTSALGEALTKLAKQLRNSKELPVLQTLAPDIQWLADHVMRLGAFWTAVILLGVVGLSSLLITHFWALGARRHPVRSAHWGTLVGSLLGIAVASRLIVYLFHRGLFHSWPSWTLAFLALFWFVVPGFFGGWAIHKLEDKPHPTREIFWYLVISSALYMAAVLATAKVLQFFFKSYTDSIDGLIWLPVSALVFQNLGWSLALYYRRKNCDPPLRPLRHAVEQSSSQPVGPTLVEMPRRDAALLPVIAPVARQAPHEMIVKPKDDRLWATAGLVLALIIGTPLYLLGTLRNDQSIASSVEGKLQQDSGLRTSGLTVHSTGRVVIISGVVQNETERAEAIQRTLSVRGVKQLIDHIQVIPVSAPPDASSDSAIAPAVQPPPATGPSVAIGITGGGGSAGTVNTQKTVAPPKAAPAAQKPAATSKTADSPKHPGLLHFLNKDKANPAGTANPQNPAQTQKPADTPTKQGFFHFLKKDKTKDQKPNVAKTPNKGPAH
jgi:hypothetical protein